MKRRGDSLGAMTDDPIALANRAVRDADAAIRTKDRLKLREAANGGYWAECAAADVAADRLGLSAPGGHSARLETLRKLEHAAKLRRGLLTADFETARKELHGARYHGDDCPRDDLLIDQLENVRQMTKDAVEAIGRLPARRRSRKSREALAALGQERSSSAKGSLLRRGAR
jgi:hypothetical protein